MKTQIITLESHDDLISVRDKLSWAKTPRILLVWPKYEKVTLRVLDLKVLQRHADSLGAQLGLVTRRANVRRDAESLGIPVFASTTIAQKETWPESVQRSQRIPKTPRRDLRQMRDSVYEKESLWRTSLLGRVLTFTVGVIAFVTVASLFVPRAAVTLYPEAQTQTIIIPVAASEATDSVSIAGNVPARTVSVTVSIEQTLAIISKISVPKSKAQGIARFTNLSQGEVKIPAGTVLSTTGDVPVRFVTLNDTILKSGVDEFVEVPIEAQTAGENGNVSADSISIVDGPLGLSIVVTNPSALSGGSDSTLIGATDEDRAKLHESAMENVRRDTETKLRAQLASDDLLLMDTFDVAKVIDEMYDPPAGQPGKQLKLNLQVEFDALYVSAEDMKQLSFAALDSSIPDEFLPVGEAAFKPLTDPSTDTSGISHFELNVTRALLRKVDDVQILSLIRGRGIESAKQELILNLPMRQNPEITLKPAWWPWMPLIPFNISVESK